MSKIPKLIHYVWLGPDMPALQWACLSSWRKHCPDYEIVKWDESNIPNNHFVKNLIKKKHYAFASDYIRLHVLSEFGGVYLDTDIELIKNIDSVLDNSVFVCEESPGRLSNGVSGCVAGTGFFRQCMNYMIESFERRKIILYSPEVTTNVYKLYPEEVRVYEQSVFFPYNPYTSEIKNLMIKDINESTLGVHHFAKTWRLSYFERLKRYLNR